VYSLQLANHSAELIPRSRNAARHRVRWWNPPRPVVCDRQRRLRCHVPAHTVQRSRKTARLPAALAQCCASAIVRSADELRRRELLM